MQDENINLFQLEPGTDLLNAGITPEMCKKAHEQILKKYEGKNTETREDYERHNIHLSLLAWLGPLRNQLEFVTVTEEGLIHVRANGVDYFG